MQIGLFICDHVAPSYQKEFGDYPDMFAKLFPEFEFRLYDVVNGVFPKTVDECEVYMATGSKHSVYEKIDWIEQLKIFIKEIYLDQKYFIGFCFGHQLMGEALGGRVAKAPTGWCVGVHQFDIYKKENWMHPFIPTMNLLMMCQDQVLEMPPDSVHLAGNAACPIAMYRVGRTMLGIQAHPEFSKAYDQLLMEKRIARMGEELVEKGIKSLTLDLHQRLFRDWVRGFLKEG